jgi:transposase InsO family protein
MGLRCGLRKKFLEPRIVLGQGQPYRRNFMSPVLRKYSSSDELTPAHSPKANAICERVIGTIRREYSDWLIPLSESHLHSILKACVGHYNRGRPHMALGPGVPDPPSAVAQPATQLPRHRIGECLVVRARPLLGGLHREYSLAPAMA